MDAVPLSLCNPAGIFFRGKRVAVPGVVVEPVGDIIGQAAVPEENGQVAAGIDIIRALRRKEVVVSFGVEGQEPDRPDRIGESGVELEFRTLKDLRSPPSQPFDQVCMAGDLVDEFIVL